MSASGQDQGKSPSLQGNCCVLGMRERTPARSSNRYVERDGYVLGGMGADTRETNYSDVLLQVCEMTIVQCYAPTNDATEEKDEFYEQLQAAKDKIPKQNLCIIMGDFNAKVGSDNTTLERTMGRNGIGDRNENGQQLVEFCSENGMVITGTIFNHKDIHKYTWTSSDNNTQNQIDHILVNGKYRRSLLDTKARRGTYIGSDHQLVISELKLMLKRTDKKNKVERRRYVRKLRDPNCREFRIRTEE